MQNKKILKKVLDELNQPIPRLDYIKGMLEVLIGDEEIITPQNNSYLTLSKDPQVNMPFDSSIPPAPDFSKVIIQSE